MEFALIISIKCRDKDRCTYPAEGIIGRASTLRRGEVFRNGAKRLLAEKEEPSAAWLQTANPITTEIMAKAGFDILMVDMEHRSGGIMDLIGQLQTVPHYDVIPFVRVPWNDSVTIKWILNAGVSGILVPCVNSAEEAVRAVNACKYPLERTRGTVLSPRAGGCGMDQRDYLGYVNEELDVLVVVEIKTATDHIEEIVKIDGLDRIFVGPAGLATSFGHFCNPKDEEIQEAIRKVEVVVLGPDKFLTTAAGSFEKAEKLYEKGYNVVTMVLDTTMLGKVVLDQVEQFKEIYLQR